MAQQVSEIPSQKTRSDKIISQKIVLENQKVMLKLIAPTVKKPIIHQNVEDSESETKNTQQQLSFNINAYKIRSDYFHKLL